MYFSPWLSQLYRCVLFSFGPCDFVNAFNYSPHSSSIYFIRDRARNRIAGSSRAAGNNTPVNYTGEWGVGYHLSARGGKNPPPRREIPLVRTAARRGAARKQINFSGEKNFEMLRNIRQIQHYPFTLRHSRSVFYCSVRDGCLLAIMPHF